MVRIIAGLHHYLPPTKLQEGNVFSRVWSVSHPVHCEGGDHYPWCIRPHDQFKLSYTILFSSPAMNLTAH